MQYKDGKAVITRIAELSSQAAAKSDEYRLLSEACQVAREGVATHGGKLDTTEDLEGWEKEFKAAADNWYDQFNTLHHALETIAGECGCTLRELLDITSREED